MKQTVSEELNRYESNSKCFIKPAPLVNNVNLDSPFETQILVALLLFIHINGCKKKDTFYATGVAGGTMDSMSMFESFWLIDKLFVTKQPVKVYNKSCR